MSKEETPNLFRTDELVQSEKAIDFSFKSLKAEWNHDDEFLMKVAKQFECASEGNIFDMPEAEEAKKLLEDE